ncbi:hypothetical protein BJX96DRAFT_125713 [Aspergillus floccosus]
MFTPGAYQEKASKDSSDWIKGSRKQTPDRTIASRMRKAEGCEVSKRERERERERRRKTKRQVNGNESCQPTQIGLQKGVRIEPPSSELRGLHGQTQPSASLLQGHTNELVGCTWRLTYRTVYNNHGGLQCYRAMPWRYGRRCSDNGHRSCSARWLQTAPSCSLNTAR